MRVAKSWKQGGLTGSADLSFDMVPEVNRLELPTRTCCEVKVLEDRVICGLFKETAAGSHESSTICCDRHRDSREGWAKLWRGVLLGRVNQHGFMSARGGPSHWHLSILVQMDVTVVL